MSVIQSSSGGIKATEGERPKWISIQMNTFTNWLNQQVYFMQITAMIHFYYLFLAFTWSITNK